MAYHDSKTALRTLTVVAATQGGYFTAKQAEKAGYDAQHLSYHLKAGNFERVGHGLYRIPTLPFAEHDDLLRLWLWSRGHDDQPRAVISHQTALAMHELAEFIPTEIHLTVPSGFRKKSPEGCTLHKGQVDSSETQPFDALPVTTPIRTMQDLAGDPSIPAEQFEQAVMTALERGLILQNQVSELMELRRGILSKKNGKDKGS